MDDNIINQNQNFYIPKDDDKSQINQDDSNNHRDINVHDPYDLILGNVSPVKVSGEGQSDLQKSTKINDEATVDDINLHSSVHQNIGVNNSNIDNPQDGSGVVQPITDINTDNNVSNLNIPTSPNIGDVQANTVPDINQSSVVNDTFNMDSTTDSDNQNNQDIGSSPNSYSSNIGDISNTFVGEDTGVNAQVSNIGDQNVENQGMPQNTISNTVDTQNQVVGDNNIPTQTLNMGSQSTVSQDMPQNTVSSTVGMQNGENVSFQTPTMGNQNTLNQSIPQNTVSNTVDAQNQSIGDNNVPTNNNQNIYSQVNIDQNVASNISGNVNQEESIIGIISYVIGINIITLAVSFIKNDKFMKFHSLQSIFFNILFLIIFFIFDFLSHGFLSLGFLIANVVLFIIWILLSIFLMYKAFIGEKYSFTFFGKLAGIFVK